jgi:hypothetical protein
MATGWAAVMEHLVEEMRFKLTVDGQGRYHIAHNGKCIGVIFARKDEAERCLQILRTGTPAPRPRPSRYQTTP